jgi:hypothetical protein
MQSVSLIGTPSVHTLIQTLVEGESMPGSAEKLQDHQSKWPNALSGAAFIHRLSFLTFSADFEFYWHSG